jgi:hypothetical protein
LHIQNIKFKRMSKHKITKAIERLDAKCYTCDDIETNCADLVVPHAKISWNIVDCLCTAVIGTTGTYFTLLDCEGALSESCQESWNCINGNCIDPGNGLGMYTTLLACQSECRPRQESSWNCVDGNCIDPGDGLGMYTTLSACQSRCKPREVSTWVLTGGGDLPCICEEIAGTSGQYTNEIDCLEALALDPNCCGTICSQLPAIPGPPDGHCRKYRQYIQGGGVGPNPATEVANILNITTAEAEYLLDTCCDCNPSSTGETTPTGWPVGVDCDKGIDAIFLVDYTSSMSSAVSAVKTGITSTVTTIVSLMSSGSSYRLALVIADEGGAALPSYQNSPYYNTLPSAQRVIVPNALASRHQYYTAMEKFATNNLSSFQIRVNSLDTGPLPGMQMGDGMNYPEPTDVLLGMCIEGGNFAGAFRSNVAKYVFIYTDVPPSGVDDQFTFHDVNRLAALKAVCLANGIKVMVLGNGVNAKHYPGGVNTGPFIYPWRELATGTGGDFHTSYSATTLNALITNGCK